MFADECGIQEDLVREKGRIQDKIEIRIKTDKNGNRIEKQIKKAQKLYGNKTATKHNKTATKHNKTGLIASYCKLPDSDIYQYIAPMIYQDTTCDTILFNTWLKECLIPETTKLQMRYPYKRINLVIDNVPYHKSQTTTDLCISHNINLVFQPPYSPDLNPIEPSWTHTKNDIRSQSYDPTPFQDKLCNSLNSRSYYG